MNQNLNSTDSKNVSKECDCFICTLQWNVKNLHYFPSSKETDRIKPFHVRFSEPALNFVCCKLQLSDQELVICTVYY